MDEKLLTTETLAELLLVSPRSILRERLAGRISYKRIRGRIRFSQEDIDNYIQRQIHLSTNSIEPEVEISTKIRMFAGRN